MGAGASISNVPMHLMRGITKRSLLTLNQSHPQMFSLWLGARIARTYHSLIDFAIKIRFLYAIWIGFALEEKEGTVEHE